MTAAKGDSQIAADLNEAIARNRDAVAARLESLGQRILDDGLMTSDATAPLSYYALARFLDYVVLDATVPIPGDTTVRIVDDAAEELASDRRNWQTVLSPYKALQTKVDGNVLPVIETHALRSFCQLKSMKQGARNAAVYAALLILVVYLAEKSVLNGTRLKRALPPSERRLPEVIRAVVDREILADLGAGSGRRGLSGTRTPSVYLRVAYQQSDATRFEAYRERLASGADGAAHFVVYRPSRSRPNRLIKSFLSISGLTPERYGDGEPDILTFTHIYIPPETADNWTPRITRGRVIPLEDGVYLVGGQRHSFDDRGNIPDRPPAKALKAMVLPWTKIRRGDAILPMLAMSTNYDGTQLVTRAAARASPLATWADLRLGGVEIAALQDDLLQDAGLERAALSDGRREAHDGFPLCRSPEGDEAVRKATSQILRLTNDNPDPARGWDIPGGFVGERGGALDREKLRQLLSRALEKKSGGTAYHRRADEPFSLRESLRFGPLTQAD